MTSERQDEFMREMEKCAREITESVALEQRGESRVLRCLFTTTRDGGGVSLFETELQELPVGAQIEIYAAPQQTIDESCIPEMEKAFQNLNYFVPLGAFGIQYSDKTMFLRYTFLVDEEWETGYIVEKVKKLYEYIAIVLGNQYDALERIMTGKSTYEQEADAGNLLRQQQGE